jgi:hypothetical protein
MTDTMRAIEISAPGGPEVLRPATRPVPEPMAEQILIAVDHAGVNRPDALQRAGSYAPPPGASDLPGLEAAGVVARVGPGVTRWKEGDAVTALLPGGGYAEYALTHQDHALPVPRGMGMAEAAALCETFFTVWTNVFMRGGSAGRGTVPRPWRVVRHRHHRDPACPPFRRAGLRHGGIGREMRGLRAAGRGAGDQLPRGGFRRDPARRGWCEPDPRHGRRSLPAAQRQGAGR